VLAAPHILAGAALAKVVRRPWLAVAVAFGSHFLLDIVPHIDSHGLFGVRRGGPTRGEALSALVDVAIGTALVLAMVSKQPRRRAMIAAAFAAIVLDLVDNVPPWGPYFQAWGGTAWLSAFHHGIQHNLTRAQWPLGIATQLPVIVLAVWLLSKREEDVR
jgi:hypothetical protein